MSQAKFCFEAYLHMSAISSHLKLNCIFNKTHNKIILTIKAKDTQLKLFPNHLEHRYFKPIQLVIVATYPIPQINIYSTCHIYRRRVKFHFIDDVGEKDAWKGLYKSAEIKISLLVPPYFAYEKGIIASPIQVAKLFST